MAVRAAQASAAMAAELVRRQNQPTANGNTVYVYVLPPLVGLPFDQMRRNGEAARHKGDKHWQNLMIVHAVFMCLAFLLLIPFAIYQARFKAYKNPRRAIKTHIFTNFTTIIFATIGFVTAYYAVGKRRSWTNPHHIIGLTIYVALMVQALLGMWVHHRGKYTVTPHIPFRTMLHRWFGRAVALLAFAQVPLGMTLYGAPAVAFILYSIWMFLLLSGYFLLEFYRGRHQSSQTVTTDTGYDYHTSGSEKPAKQKKGLFSFGNVAKAGVGLFAAKKVKDHYNHRDDRTDTNTYTDSGVRTGGVGYHSREHTLGGDDDEESYLDEHHARTPGKSPGAKTGLLAGFLGGRAARKRARSDASTKSPSAQKPGFFAGMLGRRKRGADLSMGASPKKRRNTMTGDGGWFAKRRRDREQRSAVTDYTSGYDSDYESTMLASGARPTGHAHHGVNNAAALGAGAAAGGLAAAHHHRHHNRNGAHSPSDDSYMYSEVNRAQGHIHPGRGGGIQPPPVAQNVSRMNNTRMPPSTLATSMTRTSLDGDRYTESGVTGYTQSQMPSSSTNPNVRPGPGGIAYTGPGGHGYSGPGTTTRDAVQIGGGGIPATTAPTNPNFYQKPETVVPTFIDSAAQVSTSNLGPNPTAPPIIPIPMPPDNGRSASYRLGQGSGPNTRRLNNAGGLGIRQVDDHSDSDLTSNEPSRTMNLIPASSVHNSSRQSIPPPAPNPPNPRLPITTGLAAGVPNPNLLSPSGASRTYRGPQQVTTSRNADSDTDTGHPLSSVDSHGHYKPQAALQVRIKKEENGRTVTTIKRMPNREDPSSSTATSPITQHHHHHRRSISGTQAAGFDEPVVAGPSGTNAVDGGAERWDRVARREARQEEELKREREERRERRRRRKTLSAEGTGSESRPEFT